MDSVRTAAQVEPADEAIAVPAEAEPALARVAARLRCGRRVPRATYRLQFNRDFTFAQARALIEYLAELGVSDLYASPFLQAHADSTHGYDIINHNALNPAIGDEADIEALVAALRRHGMGLILDMVPNHMGINANDNRWWQEVLENGRASPYSGYFDIDWESARGTELPERVLLPVLGDPYGRVLESGQLRLSFEGGAFGVDYWERRFPIDPQTYPLVLQPATDALAATRPASDSALLELQSIITAARNLPGRHETDPERVAERQREKEVIKRRLAALTGDSPEVAAALGRVVAELNGAPGDPASFDRLDDLLHQQPYRLAYWRVAGEEINYRRFFDVNGLAGVRVEEPRVFADTHALVLRLLAEGKLTGLRIDHPDGLWDPARYLRELQRAYVAALVQHERGGAVAVAGEPTEADAAALARLAALVGDPAVLRRPLYVVVEKILSRGEHLPATWACDGTTGYDFANAVTGLFVDGSARGAFDSLYANLLGRPISFPELVNSSKKLLMLVAFPGDINELGFLLKRIAIRNRMYQDFTLNGLTFAVREVIAALPRYRTYRVCNNGPIEPEDRAAIDAAIDQAIRRNRRTARAIFEFIRDLLLLDRPETLAETDRDLWCHFVMTFQQTTGPVMAKGVEDTACYVYNRLVALNEVGGEPDHFGLPPAEFHRQNAERQARWPHALLATATHDTKRGEDVRARLDVLSELPREWRTAVGRWRRFNARHLARVDGEPAPDANDEYLFYQTLIGAWPLEPLDDAARAQLVARVQEYMLKATREAKVHTNWINPTEAYERGVADFVAASLDPRRARGFLNSFGPFQAKVAYFGMLNGLAQALLKLTSPGVPDLYQGTELWDLSLVDPDNRRLVDYALRRRLLADLDRREPAGDADRPPFVAALLANWPDGRIKLWLTRQVLVLRRAAPDLFAHGDYTPLAATGPAADHLCAFRRAGAGRQLMVAVPRLVARLTGGQPKPPVGDLWADTLLQLPPESPRRYRHYLTGETIEAEAADGGTRLRAADLFGTLPLALLLPAE